MQLRSTDERFLALVDQWWRVLLPKIAPFLYRSAGPILMIQVTNGSLPCPTVQTGYSSVMCAAFDCK